MKGCLEQGKQEVQPKDIYNAMGFKTSQKEAKNISKTMERMQKDFTLQQGKVYGTYALPEAYPEENDIV